MSILRTNQIQDTSGNTAMMIDDSGRITQPVKPAFTASFTSGSSLSGDLAFNLAHLNNGNHFSTSTGRFTAPVAGLYFFVWNFLFESVNGRSGSFYFKVNGSQNPTTTNGFFEQGDQSDVRWNTGWNQIISLSANDYVSCYADANVYRTNNAFSGFLL